ncbi:MAG: hypothetical protein WA733_00105 [Methylocystis sp.]
MIDPARRVRALAIARKYVNIADVTRAPAVTAWSPLERYLLELRASKARMLMERDPA